MPRRPKRRVLTIAGRKGGSGKSTLCTGIAGALALDGHRVLLIDCDSQGSASVSLGLHPNDLDGSALLYALAEGEPLPVHPLPVHGIDLVPGGFHLADVTPLAGNVDALARSLAATRSRWSHVIVDTAPALGVLSLCAMQVADVVVTPVEPSPLGVVGVRDLVSVLTQVRPDLAPLVIPSRVHTRRVLTRENLEALEAAFPDRVGPSIREATAAAESAGHGLPVTHYSPKSAVAGDIRAVTQWLSGHLG